MESCISGSSENSRSLTGVNLELFFIVSHPPQEHSPSYSNPVNSCMNLCITKRKNILENMYPNSLILHKYTIFYQYVYIFLIYMHTYIHIYVYICIWQQNTERLAGSICQENSFKVYIKGNLKRFTCFITLWSIYIPEFFHKSIWSLNWPRDCTLKQTKKTPNKWKVIFTSNSFTSIQFTQTRKYEEHINFCTRIKFLKSYIF